MKNNWALFICLICFTAFIELKAQDYSIENESYNQLTDQSKVESLEKEYGKYKKYPDSVRLPLLIALAHYPELEDVKIKVKYTDGKIAHTSAPNWSSFLIPFVQKRYTITISKSVPEHLKKTMFQHLSYNAKIGVLGHELAHSTYYQQKSKMGLLIMGLMYLNKRYRAKFERETDRIVIDHNLGPQLIQWSKEVHSIHVNDGRGELYLSEEEIELFMKDKKSENDNK